MYDSASPLLNTKHPMSRRREVEASQFTEAFSSLSFFTQASTARTRERTKLAPYHHALPLIFCAWRVARGAWRVARACSEGGRGERENTQKSSDDGRMHRALALLLTQQEARSGSS